MDERRGGLDVFVYNGGVKTYRQREKKDNMGSNDANGVTIVIKDI